MKNLTPDRLRGSLLRCLLLTGFSREHTAELLTNLVRIPNIVISSQDDIWMPRGLTDYKETTLIDNGNFLLSDKHKALLEWWLEQPRGANLPNWDIASTCTVNSKKGLLLVEAKAHDKELSEAGKSKPTTHNGEMNHIRVGTAIEQANAGLNVNLQGWSLLRDSHYQISNRFAWTWKLTTLGIPVILVYLGFLNAMEMNDQGIPFDSSNTWESCLRNHSKNIIPTDAWNSKMELNGTPVWFLIRAMQLELSNVG